MAPKGSYKTGEQRQESLTARFSASEVKLLKALRDKRQKTATAKVSISDTIVSCVKFATGSMYIAEINKFVTAARQATAENAFDNDTIIINKQ